MKKLLLVIFFAGILIGPGYLLYCVELSGSTVGSYPLFSQDVNIIGMGQSRIIKASNQRWHTPISIELFPEMNTIAFNIATKFIPSAQHTMKKIYYLLTLTKNGENILEEEFYISSKKGKKDKESIKINPVSSSIGVKTFNVNEGGEYKLDIKQKTKSEIVVSDLKLKVRQNVTIPQKNVYLPGFALLGGCLIGLIVVGKKKT